MVLWLLRWFRGFLTVRLEGVYSEKFLSKMAEEKITVWKLKYQKGTIYGKMLAKDFFGVKKLRKGTGIKIKILSKHGLPFLIRMYKHRIGLIVGAVIFFVILELLSSFIWIINVEGNKTVASHDIIKTLNSIGIFETMPASAVNSKITAQKLLLERNDLAWASLNVEGCVLSVNVTEIKNTEIREELPANLIAVSDGIIRKIDAVAGDVLVKVGDNVHKGDVLVSGIIENMSSTVFVRSDAVVTAQIEKSYVAEAEFLQKIKYSTGEKTKRRVLQILFAKIPLYLKKRLPKADVSFFCKQLTVLGKKVPVKCYTAEYDFFEEQKLVLGEEELKGQLLKELNNFLDSTDIEGYIPLGTEYIKDDKGVKILHRYLCDENIARESEILVSQ